MGENHRSFSEYKKLYEGNMSQLFDDSFKWRYVIKLNDI